jgi:hypothetical protein
MKTGRYYYYDSNDLNAMVVKSAHEYHASVGRFPNRAHVNPITCPTETIFTVDGKEIIVAPDPVVVKKIIWMGEGVE